MSNDELEASEYLIENGFDYCRGKINPRYIEDIFETPGMNGVIIEIDTSMGPKYLGFILFKDHGHRGKGQKKILDFKLLCTIPKKFVPERSGIPVGKLLMDKMEEYAKQNGYKEIIASAVDTALPFYKDNKWNIRILANVKRKLGNLFRSKVKQKTESPIRKSIKGGKKKRKSAKRSVGRSSARRKHKGINQQTGRLKKGYKYSGKKLKSGLSQIIKIK